MINFFRKKRKTLADDNKALKYTRYAIGEIVLVVIGILIALSINTWNEERKIKNEEVIILQSLIDDLIIAQKQSGLIIKKEEIAVHQLLNTLNNKYTQDTNLDSRELDSIFYNVLWNFEIGIPVINTYTDIKNAGKSDLITNIEIRNRFSSLELSIQKLVDLIDDRAKVHQMRIDEISVSEINFLKLLKGGNPNFNIIEGEENDYKSMLEKKHIRNLLGIKTELSNSVLINRKDLNEEINSLIHLIKIELNLESND